MYNYYIVAYPEKKPVYKPITLIFKGGNKEEGLQQLQYAIDSSIFMKNEAAIFKAIIYYDYEDNPVRAIETVDQLYIKYPDNPYFLSQYIEFLIYNADYEKALAFIRKMVNKNKSNSYIVMKGIVMKGLIEEKYFRKYDVAYKNYNSGIKIAEGFGPIADNYLSIAYYGLSRIEKINGNIKTSKEYHKKAKDYSTELHFAQ